MRLFYGLSLPDAARAATARASRIAQETIPGRYAPPENYHITLAFLGEVDESRLHEARAVLARCVSAFPAPQISIGGFSHFGKESNGILILNVQSCPSLFPLNAALRKALSAAGLPSDPGPFSPHVTLARHADVSAGYPEAPQPVTFTASCAHLFLSARDEDGVLRYTPLCPEPFAAQGI
ncbi:MAG: RNA 2',3'-cyclic phosphodiesterase [Clostridia bacterium]|nr:RNA 2',3'-cyclic phosphodiesterase [Clostridia bacterium]